MVRHPVELALSFYYYLIAERRLEKADRERQRRREDGCGCSDGVSFDDCMLKSHIQYIQDPNTPCLRYLELMGSAITNYFCSNCSSLSKQELLDTALQNQLNMDVIGLLSEYELSLRLFEHKFPKFFSGLSLTHLQHREGNNGKLNTNDHPMRVSPQALEKLMLVPGNEIALRLFNHAEKLFWASVNESFAHTENFDWCFDYYTSSENSSVCDRVGWRKRRIEGLFGNGAKEKVKGGEVIPPPIGTAPPSSSDSLGLPPNLVLIALIQVLCALLLVLSCGLTGYLPKTFRLLLPQRR